jgi:hypothetical protein
MGRLLGKNAAHKESPRENSRPRAGLNGRYEVAQEERGSGQAWRFYRRGRVRGWRMRAGVPDRGGAWVGLVWEHGKPC